METLQTVKEIAQIIYYVALSIAGPLALIGYLNGKKKDQEEREYKTYDELDRKFFEYQKLALEYYDLDILDIPNNDPSLAFDKKRKQEQVAFAILFSLFERAYLMFSRQSDTFKKKQWSGWKHFLNDFIRRDSIRTAWQHSKSTYDTEFQAFMDSRIAQLTLGQPVATPPIAKVVGEPTGEPTGSLVDASAAASLAHNRDEVEVENEHVEGQTTDGKSTAVTRQKSALIAADTRFGASIAPTAPAT